MTDLDTTTPVCLTKVTRWEHDPEDRAAFVAGIRKLADFFEQTDAPLPYGITVSLAPYDDLRFPHQFTPEQRVPHIKPWLRRASQLLRFDRPKPGSVEKQSTEYGYYVSRNFTEGPTWAPRVRLQFSASNDVCKLVDTGETVTEEVTEIPDEVKALYTKKVEKPVMKRECPPLLEDS